MKQQLQKLPIFLSIIVLAVAPTGATAYTPNFFPGDSHFSTVLSQRSLKRVKSEEGMQFNYWVIAGYAMPCGTSGFSNLELEGETAKLKANYLEVADILLTKFISDIDNFGSASVGENSYFPVFIYNRDFDFEKATIGPRYNEDWSKVQLNMFGLDHDVYPGLDDSLFLRADMRESKEIRALEVIEPLPEIRKITSDKEIPSSTETPLGIDASKIQILILAGEEYEVIDFARRQPRRTLFRITEDSIERFETDFSGKWESVSIDAPRNKETDEIRSTLKTMKAIGNAMKIFEYRHGREARKISALIEKPIERPLEENADDWMPFFKKVPSDSWGSEISLHEDANFLISSGPDKVFETEDDISQRIHD